MRTILGLTLGLLLIVFATPSSASGIWGGKKPEHLWSKGLGGFGADGGRGVAVDAAGNVVVVGYFQNAVDFGGGTLVSAGSYDIFVAKYNASGAHQWSKRFGNTDSDGGSAVAVDGSGNIFVMGAFQGTVDFGGGNLVSTGYAAIFVAKFSASGAHQWSQRFESTESTSGYYLSGLAVDGSGNVVVSGGFKGAMDLGGGNLVSAGGFDTFLANYNASGAYQWSKRIGNTDDDFVGGPSVDGSGNVFVTGSFQSTVNVGGGNLVSAGDYDIFLAKYNASGAHQWSRRFGSADGQFGHGVGVDGSGNVCLMGTFDGTVDFGGGNLVSAGNFDIVLAKYTANGVHRWSKRLGSPGYESDKAVAVDGSGNVFLTGSFDGTVDFGGGNLVSAGKFDIFLAKFNEYGGLEYSRRFGDTESDVGNAVGVDASGNAVVVGLFKGTVDFGGGGIVSGGDYDIFVAKYGNPPGILHIADFPSDVGRVVGIHFMSSAHDAPGMDPLVTQYQAFRWTDTPVGPGWEYAAEMPAITAGEYVMDAPTDADSTCTSGQHWSKFFIRAMTSDPAVFFDSQIDSGYSVDNLAPGVPTNLIYMTGQLTWDESSAADFDHFSVYGSNTNSFAAATLVDYTVTPAMNVAAVPYNYYFVTATDHSCNEGNPANAGTLTGVGGTPTSYVLSISAYPNPFNPETTIRYTLPAKGRVTIDVFDARGAHVATLVDAVTPAGAYTVTWSGRDDRGNAVASGVFFARLTSAAGARSYKMTLLK
jgi:hypothetical protein